MSCIFYLLFAKTVELFFFLFRVEYKELVDRESV